MIGKTFTLMFGLVSILCRYVLGDGEGRGYAFGVVVIQEQKELLPLLLFFVGGGGKGGLGVWRYHNVVLRMLLVFAT